mmetsp:Transcript_105296/g.298025  ORF Transcript_105296/g.298025 Transcript_105296/m.298025 type:complete len:255 (-) Transcript_105296:312-1076(-)
MKSTSPSMATSWQIELNSFASRSVFAASPSALQAFISSSWSSEPEPSLSASLKACFRASCSCVGFLSKSLRRASNKRWKRSFLRRVLPRKDMRSCLSVLSFRLSKTVLRRVAESRPLLQPSPSGRGPALWDPAEPADGCLGSDRGFESSPAQPTPNASSTRQPNSSAELAWGSAPPSHAAGSAPAGSCSCRLCRAARSRRCCLRRLVSWASRRCRMPHSIWVDLRKCANSRSSSFLLSSSPSTRPPRQMDRSKL